MATYTYEELHGQGKLMAEDLEQNIEYTFTLTNPSQSAYFTMETIRDTDGFYNISSPKNINGDFTSLISVESLVTSSYIAGVVVPAGGGAFNFTPTNDVIGTTLYLRGTGYVGLTIDGVVVTTPILYYDPATSYSGTGTVLTDLSGNGRNATIVGAPPYTSGEGGYFTLSNDRIDTPNLNSIITAGDEAHSVEVWIYPTANGVIASYQGNAYNTGYHFSAIELVAGQARFGLWNGTGISSTGNVGALALNTWHQVVLTYDGVGLQGYINGAAAGSPIAVLFDSPMDDGDPSFYIAFGAADFTDQGDGSYFDGRMGIIRMYDRALTATEVLQNFENGRDQYGI